MNSTSMSAERHSTCSLRRSDWEASKSFSNDTKRLSLPRKTELTRQVLDEVRSFKKQHRELATAAERPETIGGAVRGFEKAQGMNRPDIAVIATEISAPGFAARTFTIDHQ